MISKNKINAKNLIASFRCAISGLWEVLIHEPPFRYMVVIAVFVLIAMFVFPTSRTEKVAVLTMIFAVLGFELINSVFERFLDFLQPEYDERVRIIKDMMSAIVLVVSLGAAIIGIVIFLPHFCNLFR